MFPKIYNKKCTGTLTNGHSIAIINTVTKRTIQ